MSFQSYRQLRQKEAQLVEQIRGEIRLSEPEALVAYLPNFMPPKPVEYIVLAMEPSMAWAKTEEEAQQQVNKGYRNFMHSWEDFLLHHPYVSGDCGHDCLWYPESIQRVDK